jgi:hypothetical protein
LPPLLASSAAAQDLELKAVAIDGVMLPRLTAQLPARRPTRTWKGSDDF